MHLPVIRPHGAGLQIRVYAGIDPATGKRMHLVRSTRSGRKAAERIERELIGLVEQGRTRDERITVGELLTKWLAHRGPQLSPTTLEGYQRIVDQKLIPVMGKLLLEKLSGVRLDALYDDLAERGLGPSGVHQVHAVVHAACNQAIKWGHLRWNPADAASPPVARRKELQLPVEAELTLLYQWAFEHDPPLAVLIRLAAATGARRGELLALRWSDLDLDGEAVSISRGRVAVKGRVLEKSTKGTGERPMAIDPKTVSILRAHRRREVEKALRCGRPFELDAPIITGREPGVGWYPDTATARFSRARRATGVSARVKLKNMRHAHISWLLEDGEPVLNVSKRAGHASTKMTLDVYGHKIRATDRSAATKVAKRLDG